MSIPTLSLAGKKAVVTGGKRGIGKAIALAYAEAGADVAVCSRKIDDGALLTTAEEIRKLGRQALAVQADVSKKSDVDALARQVIEAFGTVDVLVNNVAINILSPLLDLREDGWDKIMNNDLKSYYLCAQAFGRGMVEKKRGVILNISSRAGFIAQPKLGGYCIAKAGINMLTRVLAVELGPSGVRVAGIAPSTVKTDFSAVFWKDSTLPAVEKPQPPLGYIAETKDIIGAALFLASDAASYLTGQTIIVDGGGLA